MRLTLLHTPKPSARPILCVPSQYCLRCNVEKRLAVCFFKQPKPTRAVAR